MKSIFLILIVFSAFTVSPVFGQTSVTKQSEVCTEETIKKISSRGIKLGMNSKDVLNLFAENGKLTAVNYEFIPKENLNKISFVERDLESLSNRLQSMNSTNFGFSFTALSPTDKIKFDGISYYDLGFLDDRLTFFRVYYTKPIWESREQLIKKMSELINLPVVENNLNTSPYEVKCGDYKVGFEVVYNDEIKFQMNVSANFDEVLKQRRKKAEDEQREKDIKTFKP